MAQTDAYAPPAAYVPCSSVEGPESLSLAPGDELWLVQLPPRMNVGAGSSWTVTKDADGKLLAETRGGDGGDALRLEADVVGSDDGPSGIAAPVPLVVPQRPGASAVKISRVATIFRSSDAQRLCFGDADVVADPGGDAARILAGGEPERKAARPESGASVAKSEEAMEVEGGDGSDDEGEEEEEEEEGEGRARPETAEPLAEEEGSEADSGEDEEEAKEAEAFRAELQAQETEKSNKQRSKHGDKESKKHAKSREDGRDRSEERRKKKKKAGAKKDKPAEVKVEVKKEKSEKKRSHKGESKEEKKKKKKSKH